MVITDETTKAVIKFNDGSQIEINPQSMIKLEFAKNENGLLSIAKSPKVEVLKGNVSDVGLKQLEITKITKAPTKERRYSDFKTKISHEQIQKLELTKSRSIAQESNQIKEQPLVVETVKEQVSEPMESVQVTPVASKQIVAPESKPEMKTKPSVLKQVETEKPLIAGLSSLNSNAYNGEDLRTFFVDLSWQPYYQATAYLVKFYQDEKLTNLWFSAKTKENKYRMNQMFNGNLYYVVEAYRGNSKVGASLSKSLTFNYQAPELKNPKNNTVLNSEDMQYLFTWDKKNFTSEYVLEIAKDPSFSSGYKKTVKENFVSVPLLKGTYYWRVFAKNGELLSTSSKINVVTIKKESP